MPGNFSKAFDGPIQILDLLCLILQNRCALGLILFLYHLITSLYLSLTLKKEAVYLKYCQLKVLQYLII